MRGLIVLAIIAGGLYFYAERFGLAVGYAPFTPVYYWNYSGESANQLRSTGVRSFIKVKVGGQLNQGSLQVELRSGRQLVGNSRVYTGNFGEELRFPVESGNYTVVFRFKDVRGQARLDWVSASNDY